MEVRDMIAKLMKDKEVTYAELEKRTGLPRSVLNRYVNGVTKKIPIDNLEKIAKALGVAPVYFVVGDIEIRPEDGRTYIDPAAAVPQILHFLRPSRRLLRQGLTYCRLLPSGHT